MGNEGEPGRKTNRRAFLHLFIWGSAALYFAGQASMLEKGARRIKDTTSPYKTKHIEDPLSGMPVVEYSRKDNKDMVPPGTGEQICHDYYDLPNVRLTKEDGTSACGEPRGWKHGDEKFWHVTESGSRTRISCKEAFRAEACVPND